MAFGGPAFDLVFGGKDAIFRRTVAWIRPASVASRPVPTGKTRAILGLLMLLTQSGCASIVSGRYAEVSIDSYPSNADVVIRDSAGREVAELRTPGVVALRRNRRFFMPARYAATIEAPGYQPAQVPIRSTVNPWLLGNVIVGGIPGLVIDGATGAAWKPRRPHIQQNLVPRYSLRSNPAEAAADEAVDAAPIAR